MKAKPRTATKVKSQSIEERIEKFIIHEERLKVESIPYDAHLSLSGMLDSLSHAALLVFVHKEFGVFINFHEVSFDEFDTIGKLAHLIRKRRAAKKRKS